MPHTQLINEYVDEMVEAGIPKPRADWLAGQLIEIGKGSQMAAQEQERRKAYREKVAADDGVSAVSVEAQSIVA